MSSRAGAHGASRSSLARVPLRMDTYTATGRASAAPHAGFVLRQSIHGTSKLLVSLLGRLDLARVCSRHGDSSGQAYADIDPALTRLAEQAPRNSHLFA